MLSHSTIPTMDCHRHLIIQAINLNNHAHFLLENGGEINIAIYQLSNALKLVKEFKQRAHQEMGFCDPLPGCAQRPADSMDLNECMMQSMVLTTPTAIFCHHNEESESYMHRHAMLIPNTFQEVAQRDHFYSSLIVSIIALFNLSLAHQLQAEKESDPSTRFQLLTKATKLYQLSFSMCQNHLRDGSWIFTMTVFNNLGVAFEEMRDFVSSERCFQRMLSILILPTEHILRACREHDMCVSLCNLFRQNITTRFVAPPTAACAA